MTKIEAFAKMTAHKRGRVALGHTEEQIRAFAYGNVAIENPNVTRAMIDEAANRLGRPPR